MELTIKDIVRETGLEESLIRFYESEYPDRLPARGLRGDHFVYPPEAVAAFNRLDREYRERDGVLPAAQDAAASRYGRVIAVTSGKGGVGKTSVALNLAIALQRAGKMSLVLDADMGMANVHLLAGLAPEHDLGDLLTGACGLAEIIVEGPEGIGLIPGGSGTALLADSSTAQRRLILEALAEVEQRTDIMLVDTGAGMGQGVREFLAAADELLFVLTPDLTSLADAYGLLKTLQLDGKVGKRPVYCLVNMVDSLRQAAEVARRFSSCAEQFLGVKVENIGYIMRDATVTAALNQRTPLVLFRPACRAARNIANVATALLHCRDSEVLLASAFKRYLKLLGDN